MGSRRGGLSNKKGQECSSYPLERKKAVIFLFTVRVFSLRRSTAGFSRYFLELILSQSKYDRRYLIATFTRKRYSKQSFVTQFKTESVSLSVVFELVFLRGPKNFKLRPQNWSVNQCCLDVAICAVEDIGKNQHCLGVGRGGGGGSREKRVQLRRSTIECYCQVSQHFCSSLWVPLRGSFQNF